MYYLTLGILRGLENGLLPEAKPRVTGHFSDPGEPQHMEV